MTATPLPVTYVDGPLVVGAGLAGLATAIGLAPRPVTVLSAGPLGCGTSTGWAQGGIAAAVGPDDAPELHAQDTLAAGAGLCDPDVVARIVADGPAAIELLTSWGAAFDRDSHGRLRLGLEGAHCRRRVAHAGGDGTGAELQRVALTTARALPSVTLLEGRLALQVLVDRHGIAGLLVDAPDGRRVLAARQIVLATGGIGGLYTHTTNPLTSRGQGLALAARAGAVVRDPEMVQFHPTGLDVGIDPMPLVSEAVRGEGAVLVTASGEPVLGNPLAARDVVSRAEWAWLQAGEQVFLDARAALGEGFAGHFPTIDAHCRAAGLDPAHDLVPVRPAAHYHMGGVLTDPDGRTTVAGLWAVGECASTGLHGANRLASNSLLEAVVVGTRVAGSLLAAPAAGRPTAADLQRLGRQAVRRLDRPAPLPLAEIRALLEGSAGVLRDRDALVAALDHLAPAAETDDDALAAALVCRGALARRESRGGHTRTDHPGLVTPRHTLLTLADVSSVPFTERTAS